MSSEHTSAFSSIALSMSGGGYRAAAFHLGTMMYLSKVDLLSKVEMISTVSGGTFTGVMYALKLKEAIEKAKTSGIDKSIDYSKEAIVETFHSLHQSMAKIDLVEKGLELLCTGKAISSTDPNKELTFSIPNKKLITAMAEIYHVDFFEEKYFAEFWDEGFEKEAHLKDIIFNATEFANGLTFRFMKGRSQNAKIGNNHVYLNPELAEQLRLGDIVATSSCFPAGFEPMDFPYDYYQTDSPLIQKFESIPKEEYIYPNRSYFKPDKNNTRNIESIALMDGGIADNQGINSIRLTNEENRKINDTDEHFPDLFIISDVSSNFITPYKFPGDPHQLQMEGALTIGDLDKRVVKYSFLALAVVVVLFIAEIYMDITGKTIPFLKLGGKYVVFLAFVVTLYFIYRLVKAVREFVDKNILDQVPNVEDHSWAFLRKITLKKYGDLIKVRVTSTIKMTSDIFMKQIRRLVYDSVYDFSNGQNRYSQKDYNNKIISNLIFTLIKSETERKGIEISQALKDTCSDAFTMDTTLWFSDDQKSKSHVRKLDKLIISGQATICYRMRKHLAKRFDLQSDTCPQAVKDLAQKLDKDWKSFNEKPSFLLDDFNKKLNK